MAKVGEHKNGELWVRCWICGDSERNPDHAHMSINGDGLFHCVRCNAGGKLSSTDFLRHVDSSLLSQINISNNTTSNSHWKYVYDDLLPGPGNQRHSLLPRYHTDIGGKPHDVFVCRDSRGDPIGLATVSPDGQKSIMGNKGVSWVGDGILLSSPDSPIRLVEGPYDVMYSNDVCVYGIPDANALYHLRTHSIILCPDGDVWTFEKRQILLKLLRTITSNNTPCQILGMEKLPDDLDPDECPVEHRQFIPVERCHQLYSDLTAYRNILHI